MHSIRTIIKPEQYGFRNKKKEKYLISIYQEVEYVWPKLGYPPLVTPFSQYTKNTALLNLMSTIKGEPRWKNIDPDTWNMILGKAGKLPGPLAPEIVALAKEKGYEFYDGEPQDAYPDQLDHYRQVMKENGWDCGQDDEELFELAMHERQYMDYKSGVAKQRFEKDLEAAREKAGAPIIIKRPVVEVPKIDISQVTEKYPEAQAVQAPTTGQVVWQYDVVDTSTAPKVGDKVKEGDVICRVQAYYGLEEIKAPATGKFVAIYPAQGANVKKDEILAFINPGK